MTRKAACSVSAVPRSAKVSVPGVGHHVREGTARAETGHGAAMPAVTGPTVEHSPDHQRSAQVAGQLRGRQRTVNFGVKPVGGTGAADSAVARWWRR